VFRSGMLVGWTEYGSYYTVKRATHSVKARDTTRHDTTRRDALRKKPYAVWRHDLTSATQPAPNDAAATAIHYD
jgi:hypothetical protein